MNLHDHPSANTDTALVATDEAALRIVDFVPSAMVAEEEVAWGGGVALKLQSKLNRKGFPSPLDSSQRLNRVSAHEKA